MNTTIQQIEQIVSVLTDNEKQLLKDTINHGAWGDSAWEFLDENCKVETVAMYGYCTNDAHLAGHFKGRWKSHATLTLLAKQNCPLWL